MLLWRLLRLWLRLPRFRGRDRAFLLVRRRLRPPAGEVIAPGPSGTRMRLDLGDEIDAQIFLFGDYDPASRRVMETVLRPGDTAVDAGANIGFFTLVLARAVGPAGTVVAFERARHLWPPAAEPGSGIRRHAAGIRGSRRRAASGCR